MVWLGREQGKPGIEGNKSDKGKGKGKGKGGKGKSQGSLASSAEEPASPAGDASIMKLNVDGIREERKRKTLGTCLSGLTLQPDVRIIEETHHLDTG